MKLIAYLTFGLIASTSTLFAAKEDLPPYLPVTDKVAATHYVAAAMSSSSYKQPEKHFPLQKLGWEKIDRNAQMMSDVAKTSYVAGKFLGFGSGLAFDIWRKADTKETIFAFRGTDSKGDWVKANLSSISVAYKSARKKIREFKAEHPDHKIILVTGHSLGGGLALSCSIEFGIPAVVFDTSPRVFDGIENKILPASRIAIHQQGDLLEKARTTWTKYPKVVTGIYEATYPFSKSPQKINAHSGYHLALSIITQAVKVDSQASKLLQ